MTRGYSLEEDLKLLINNSKYRSIKEDSLTKDNTVEAFHAADYFQLSDLQDFITRTVKNTDLGKNYSPELLSKISEKPLSEDNILLNLLVETVAIMPLNNIEFGRLSITGFKYLLSITHEKEMSFATPEYEVFRYSAILAANQVSNDVYNTLIELLPTLEQLDNSVRVGNKFIIDNQTIAEELKPLIEFIDFRRIKAQIIVDIIEPLKIIPTETILGIYRHMALLSNLNLSNTRGIPINEYGYVWDEKACGSKLIIEDDGKVVHAPYGCGFQNVRAKIALEDKGIFEWDVIIEKHCGWSWVGVCASENLDFERFAGSQSTGATVTVHLDMNKRTCAFTVNGTRYREVSEWKDLPPKLYPVVSLCHPGRFRIQPHRKN
ncbi:hypothetical protein GLOIN_2v1847831 [Rhizophagus clarus]|uniref:B30.2/SPRY domain-containing protein n=1 Tax=Rhizophagus clarus TaxID=94130 RepID=A0A8H3LYX3_9GLOM|nr:hypothetical protein GLOIN_2v1847831 [Rhizophagus clarus]